jgi:hypothetical protein
MRSAWACCMGDGRCDVRIGPRAPPCSGRDETAQLRIERLETGGLFLAGRSEVGRHFREPLVMVTKLLGQERRDAPGFIRETVAHRACGMGAGKRWALHYEVGAAGASGV